MIGVRSWRALALDRFCEDCLVEGRERAPWLEALLTWLDGA
ncbi:MAG TPA: hypothetical protein VJY15_17275 [Candidatus Acidoferrum sp.]|nr:hypothetical protein [Candidatus Acidoferrum sp.]